MLEIKNNLYQPFKLVNNGTTEVIPAKSKKQFNTDKVTAQIETAAERGFISYRKI